MYNTRTELNLFRGGIYSACSNEPAIEAVDAYGLFFFDDKLLASDTDIALTAPEVPQMPAFVHRNSVFTSEY